MKHQVDRMVAKTEAKARLPRNTVKAVKRIVKKENKKNTEFKQHSNGVSQSTFYSGAGSAMIHLTDVAQGATDTTRIGDELTLNHIQIKLLLRNGLTNTSNELNTVRVMIFQYKSQDFTPLYTQLLLTNVPAGGVQGSMSSRNIDYLNTYHVIWDKTFQLGYGSPNALNYGNGSNFVKYLNFSVPLNRIKKKIQYIAASANPVNGIWMMIISNSASVATNPTYACTWTIGFIDR